MAYLVLECGSSARGDANSSSDRDIVCLWTGFFPNIVYIKERYGDVMVYSLDTIFRMKSKGSLFLVHLDIDGRYLEGDMHLLDVVKGFRPQREAIYLSLDKTVVFIKDIEWYPSTARGFLWLLDSLYVSLRNCIYCINALHGDYLFGYISALEVFGLSAENIETMILIREGKYRYRKSQKAEEYLVGHDRLSRVCKEILGRHVTFQRGGTTDWLRRWDLDYWDERLIERAVLNSEHAAPEFMEKMRHHNYFKGALKKEMSLIVRSHIN